MMLNMNILIKLGEPCIILCCFFSASYFTNSISMTLYYSLRIEENVERGAISFLLGRASASYDLSSLLSSQNHQITKSLEIRPRSKIHFKAPAAVASDAIRRISNRDAFFGSMRLKEAGNCHLRTN